MAATGTTARRRRSSRQNRHEEEQRGRESRLQVFRSLMCDLPQTRLSVPPFPSGSTGFKESALGPPFAPRSLLRLPTKPYRYSVLYRHSQLTFFPGRPSFRLSDVCPKRRNAPREKNPWKLLDQQNRDILSNYFSIGISLSRQ